jgi:hypothetical protein
LSSTALPVPESRLTITRTLTPLEIMPSAMVWNCVLSPCAFWMSAVTPAASNASLRYLASAVAQRAELLVSGRMTPTLPVEELPLLPVSVPESSPQAAMLPVASRPTEARANSPLRIRIVLSGNPDFDRIRLVRATGSVDPQTPCSQKLVCCARQRIPVAARRTSAVAE